MKEKSNFSPETDLNEQEVTKDAFDYLEHYRDEDSVEMQFHEMQILHPETFLPPKDFLEYCEEIQSNIQEFFGTKPESPFILSFIYKPESWKNLKGYRSGPLKEKLGKDIVVIGIGIDKEDPQIPDYARGLFSHEYSHVVAEEWIYAERDGLMNSYINEGIAEYISKYMLGEKSEGKKEDFKIRANVFLEKFKEYDPSQFLRPDKIASIRLDTGTTEEDKMLEAAPYRLGPYIVQRIFERLGKEGARQFFQDAIQLDENSDETYMRQVQQGFADAFKKHLQMSPEQVYEWLSEGLK